MPVYEFLCKQCGQREEVLTRKVQPDVASPACPSGKAGHEMQRIVSPFARHKTVADQLADAEAKYGQEVDAAMGPEPDVGRLARRYGELSKDLPGPNDV